MKYKAILNFFNNSQFEFSEDENFIYYHEENLFPNINQIIKNLKSLEQNQICTIFCIKMNFKVESFSIYWEFKNKTGFVPEFDSDLLNEISSFCNTHKKQLLSLENDIAEDLELNGKDFQLIKSIISCDSCQLKINSELKISKHGINQYLKKEFQLNGIVVKFWLDYKNFLSKLENLSFEKLLEEMFPKSEIYCYFFLSELPDNGTKYIHFYNLQTYNKKMLNKLLESRTEFLQIREKRMKYFRIEQNLEYFPPELFISWDDIQNQTPKWLIHIPNILLYSILCTISTSITKNEGFLGFFLNGQNLKVSFKTTKDLKLELSSEKKEEFSITEHDLTELINFCQDFLTLDEFYGERLKLVREKIDTLLNSGDLKFYYKNKKIKDIITLQLEIPPSKNEFITLIKELISNYRHKIEEKKESQLLWNNNTPRKEKDIQIHFFNMLENLARAHGIIITREHETGRGPIDFKFINNDHFQSHIEIKRDLNSKLLAGLEKQLPTYLNADSVSIGFYIIFLFKTKDFESLNKNLEEIKKKIEKSRGIQIFIEYIKVINEKESASRL